MQQQPPAPSQPRRAALYIRTSSIPEIAESDLGPLQRYAAQCGYQVVATYRDDNKGSRDAKRPGLAQLRADAGQGRFDVVVVAHHTRLAPTQVDAQAIIDDFQRHGVEVDSLAGDIPL